MSQVLISTVVSASCCLFYAAVAMVTLLVKNQLGSVILSGSCDNHHHDYLTEENINFKVCLHTQ